MRPEILEVIERDRQLLAEVWRDGVTDGETVERLIAPLKYRIPESADIARRTVDLLGEIADSGLPVPTAHIILSDCYRLAHGVAADPHRALHHLEAAVRLGSDEARWRYGLALSTRNEGFAGALAPDPERALEIFRELASRDYVLAFEPAIELLIKGKHAGELPRKDEFFVQQYADTSMVGSRLSFELARFFSEGLTSSDFAGYEYKRARDFLIRGMNNSRYPDVQRKCEALLDEWGVKPTPPAPPTPRTKAQKVAEGAKIAGYLGSGVALMILWAFIGSALLALASAVTAFVIPVLIVLAVGAFLVSRFRRKG